MFLVSLKEDNMNFKNFLQSIRLSEVFFFFSFISVWEDQYFSEYNSKMLDKKSLSHFNKILNYIYIFFT